MWMRINFSLFGKEIWSLEVDEDRDDLFEPEYEEDYEEEEEEEGEDDEEEDALRWGEPFVSERDVVRHTP
jgi:hypothetical protein